MLGIMDADVLVHWAARGSDTPEDAVEMLHDLMAETMEMSFADEFRIAVKGKGNYRKLAYTDYKANRKALDPELKVRLSAVHRALLADYSATMAHDQEADDLVRIWAEEAREAGTPYVIIAEDKDLRCIPGPHFNPKKREIFHVTEEEADLLYHSQLLTGDTADNIKGLWRVGPVKANKALADVAPEDRMQVVMKMWEEKHPEDWYERLHMCGTLIHIKKSHDDFFYIKGLNRYAKEKELESQV